MSVDTQLDERVDVNVDLPGYWKVIMLNDDVTPMNLVTYLLTEIFNHSTSEADKIMMQIHSEGSGIAGIYPFEIAEQKGIEATNLARKNNSPLKITIEEE